jgi:hypothetical protein
MVLGLFPDRILAESAIEALVSATFPESKLSIYSNRLRLREERQGSTPNQPKHESVLIKKMRGAPLRFQHNKRILWIWGEVDLRPADFRSPRHGRGELLSEMPTEKCV